MITYIKTLQDIQVKSQHIQQGIVMCGDQQMQPKDFCVEEINGSNAIMALDPSSVGNTYEKQRQVNRQDVQNEEQNNRQNLFTGLIEILVAIVLIILFLFQIRKKSQSA
jgi:hypothetical protein